MDKWISIIQAGVIGAAGIICTLLYRGFQAGRWTKGVEVKSEELAQLRRDFLAFQGEIRTILDDAGERQSHLGTVVQGLPERMRRDFLPRPEADLMFQESAKDRERIWVELGRLWKELDRRRNQRN